MLCCAVLCCAVRCCAVLCRAVLCCTVLCRETIAGTEGRHLLNILTSASGHTMTCPCRLPSVCNATLNQQQHMLSVIAAINLRQMTAFNKDTPIL